MLKLPSLPLSALLLRLLAVALCVGLFACDDSEETGENISLNCAGEVDTGSTSTVSISGYVIDGKTGSKLSGTVNLYNSTGTTLLDNSSVSSSSKYSFSGLTPSTYVVKSVISNYTTATDSLCLVKDNDDKSLSVLTPAQAEKANVIVLTWSSGVNDLDSHLISSGGSPSPSHIGYRRPDHTASGSGYDNASSTSEWAWFDKDATRNASNCTSTSNCPPETLTIKLDSTNGPIRNSVSKACYYVYIWSSGKKWSDITAEVKLFQSDGSALTNFNSPSDSSGNRYWHVFDLDSNLNITTKNTSSASIPTCS